MQIRAAAIGEAVPVESFDAVVQSAFESAVNVKLLNEDRLITVLVSDRYRLPQGIHIAQRDIPLHGLTPGRRVACRGGILRFESSALSIDLRGAQVWKCRVADLAMEMPSPRAQRAWSNTWKMLNRRQKQQNCDIIADELFGLRVGSSLCQRISRPIMRLVASADSFDAQQSILAAKDMIGLGPGVTPSGDDILIGFLAALWSLAGEHPERRSFIHAFGEGFMQNAHRTGEISRTYLYHAARGQFSSTIAALLEAIGSGRDVEQALQDAMRVGHSSGMDSVTGLLVGLAVWNQAYPHYPIHLQKEKYTSGKSYGHFAASD